jgi:hypothetical protein
MGHGLTSVGLRHHAVNGAYENMHSRVENRKAPRWRDWGGRGVVIDESWCGPGGRVRFWSDMGPEGHPLARNDRQSDQIWVPGQRLTLDRRDPDGPYTFVNCRWLAFCEQSKNRRSNIRVEGMCLAEYCRQRALPYHRICLRIWRGWSVEQAISAQ